MLATNTFNYELATPNFELISPGCEKNYREKTGCKLKGTAILFYLPIGIWEETTRHDKGLCI